MSGLSNAVEKLWNENSGRRTFLYTCPVCKEKKTGKLSGHLVQQHKWTLEQTKLLQTKMRVIYVWANAEKHGAALPLPYETFQQWHTRLDQHLERDCWCGEIVFVCVFFFDVTFSRVFDAFDDKLITICLGS